MPEGPSIVILKEELGAFKEKKVLEAEGNSKFDIARLKNLNIIDFKTWGKHLLICFDDFFLRIHLLMFGTYTINERKTSEPRLRLTFENGEFSFYACSIKLIEGAPDAQYDWETDIMSDKWNTSKAEKNLKALKKTLACDALLNQEIFSGVGNIIKNEVLFRTKIHPESRIDLMPSKKLTELIKDTRTYSLLFYKWKKAYELRSHWLIYNKKECPRCKIPAKRAYLGKTHRLTCYCDNCQIIYN
jgi:endonuclease-8